MVFKSAVGNDGKRIYLLTFQKYVKKQSNYSKFKVFVLVS